MALTRRNAGRWRSAARGSPKLKKVLRGLGARMRELREGLELSQEEAANRASIDPKHFQAIEAGQVNVTVASLVGITKSLKVSLSDLFEDVD